MVDTGMAMATVHAGVPTELEEVDVTGTKLPPQVAAKNNGNTRQPANSGFVTLSFTPLHTAGKGMKFITFGMIVWGDPPVVGENPALLGETAGAATKATRTEELQRQRRKCRNLALTSPAPPW
jgi:hypothetical protein